MAVRETKKRVGNGPRLLDAGRGRASASYLALARAFPIRPIRSDAELDDAIAVLDGLLGRAKPLDEQEQGYRESPGHEIELYEAAAFPMPAVSGAAMLHHLMEARGESLSAVAREAGIAVSTLSEILKKKRKLTLGHVKALAAHFGVEPGVFLS